MWLQYIANTTYCKCGLNRLCKVPPLRIKTSQHPLVVIVDLGSMLKYSGTWSMLIIFLLRTPFVSLMSLTSAVSGRCQKIVCRLETRIFQPLILESQYLRL
jgi:hypothetical protein